MTDPFKGMSVSSAGPEDLVEVYGEWVNARDFHLKEGELHVPIPVADMYITRILLAAKKIPRIVIDLPMGKH